MHNHNREMLFTEIGKFNLHTQHIANCSKVHETIRSLGICDLTIFQAN